MNTEEWTEHVGDSLRALRLARNLGQAELATQAGVGRGALQNLERGRGNLSTLVRVVRALGREDWLASLRTQTTINPLHLRPAEPPRQRASRKPRGHTPS
jgi:transcriptional regulator with XRE-family HTH domain